MSAITSDELAARVHEQLSKMDIRPQHILPESATNLRPRLRTVLSESETSFGERQSSSSSSLVKSPPSATTKAAAAEIFPESWFDWRVALVLVLVTVAAVFVYKKWFVISNLGVGYAVAETPGLEKVGSVLAGASEERVREELSALREGSHPVLVVDEEQQKDSLVQEKEELIQEMLETVKISSDSEEKDTKEEEK